MSSMPIQALLGHSLRKHFHFQDDYVPLNHGSFGTYPLEVKSKLFEYLEASEQDPDRFLRYTFPERLEESRQATAALLKADPTSIVFVPNATTGFNTVLRALEWEEGDVILSYETVYSGLAKTISYVTESTPAENEILDVQWPIDDDKLVDKFESTIKAINAEGKGKRRVRVAVFDTITSMPGFRVPFEKLTKVCRTMNVLSMVDGAQGIGQIPLDLEQLDADFFTTNLHKWLYVPRGCAILYVASRNQHLIRSSLPTSHGFKPRPTAGQRTINNPLPQSKRSAFQQLFEFVGTTSSEGWLTIPTALKFRQDICGGEDQIMKYTKDLAKLGGDRAAEILGTEVMDNQEGTLRDCALANVRLPLVYSDKTGDLGSSDIAKFFSEQSVDIGTFFAVIYYQNAYWWRISSQCYLELTDFEWGAKAMKTICERIQKGGHLRKHKL